MPNYTTQQIGKLVKDVRRSLQVTQKQLALTAGTGLRFIMELEQGKPTCQFEKVLYVIQTLGIKIDFILPKGTGKP